MLFGSGSSTIMSSMRAPASAVAARGLPAPVSADRAAQSRGAHTPGVPPKTGTSCLALV